MPSVQIKNVPEDVHRILRVRAATAGQSLQEYLLALLREQAQQLTLDEVLARVEERSGGHITMEDAVDGVRADRDAR